MIAKFGADALRLYVMFVAPPEKEVEWTDTGLEGSFRFLSRVWRIVDHLTPAVRRRRAPAALALDDDERALRRKTHVTIRRVTRRHRPADAPEHRDLRADGDWSTTSTPSPRSAVSGRPAATTSRRPVVDAAGDRGRAARGGRGAAADAVAVHAAPGRGTVGAARAHATASSAAGWPAATRRPRATRRVEIPVQVNGKVRGRVTRAGRRGRRRHRGRRARRPRS